MTAIIISLVLALIGYGIVALAMTQFFHYDGESPYTIFMMFAGSALGSLSMICFMAFLVMYLFF